MKKNKLTKAIVILCAVVLLAGAVLPFLAMLG